jgi:hypothetical protein
MNQSVFKALRKVMPPRALNHVEALRIAELQAVRFLELAGMTEPPVPESIIATVPKVELRRISPWPVSGCTDWVKGTWVIVINGADSAMRQRFTIAHEFKHILDYLFIDIAYPASPSMSRTRRAEVVCDYFAGCLLVPKVWLRRAWVSGHQDVNKLAREFQVSPQAMQTRLFQTGLIMRPDRCIDSELGFRFQRTSQIEVAA